MKYVCPFVLPLLRMANKAVVHWLWDRVVNGRECTGEEEDEDRPYRDAPVLAYNICYSTSSIALIMIVGSSMDYFLTAAVLIVDVAVATDTMGTIVAGRQFLRDFPDKIAARAGADEPLTKQGEDERKIVSVMAELEKYLIHEGATWMVITETAEVVLPLTYLCCWLVVRAGPNSDAFAGVGADAFGLKQPAEIFPEFALNILLMFAVEVLSWGAMRALVFKMADGFSLSDAARGIFAEHGKILALQSIWIVETCFCALMLACGMDYSFQFDWL